MLKKKNNIYEGFTLIEILVAMAIFAIIATLSTAGLKAVINQYQATKTAQVEIISAQRALLKITQDVLQVVYRTSKNEFDKQEDSLRLDEQDLGVTLLTGGWHNWTDQTRSNLQLVHYHLVSDQLVRSHWQILDDTSPDRAINIPWVSNVESFKVALLDKDNKVITNVHKASYLAFYLTLTQLGDMVHIVPLPAYKPVS